MCRARLSAALRATERAAGEASAGEQRPAQCDAGAGVRRSPDFMFRDAGGSRQKSDAGAEDEGAEDTGGEDTDEDEDEDGGGDADDAGESAPDETGTDSTSGLGSSGDEDSQARAPAVRASSGYAALNAKEGGGARRFLGRAAEGDTDGGGSGAAAAACMQTHLALRSVGKVARKWMATGESVGWGGLWGVGVGGDGSSSLELQQSVFRAPRDASSLLRRSVNLVGRCVSVERVEGAER